MAGQVIVGVDGSEPSVRALRWAAEDARRRGAGLRVVHVQEARVTSPYELSYASTSSPRTVERLAAEERRWHERQRLVRRQEADALLEELLEDLPAELRDVPTERIIRESQRPAQVLLDCARHADLLVVGSRGRGGFAGLLLGSVSQQLSQHAPCPVVIVPPTAALIDLAGTN